MTDDGTALELRLRKRRRITSIVRRIGWLNFKLSLAAWAIVMMYVPPRPLLSAIGYALHFTWTGMALMGALVSAVGIIISFWQKYAMKVAVPVELAGLSLMVVGPIVYFFTQFGLMLGDPPQSVQDRLALTFFAYAMIAAVVARLCTVIPRFHKES